jgi:hypothetical protein
MAIDGFEITAPGERRKAFESGMFEAKGSSPNLARLARFVGQLVGR